MFIVFILKVIRYFISAVKSTSYQKDTQLYGDCGRANKF
jgi:hypothetical protein